MWGLEINVGEWGFCKKIEIGGGRPGKIDIGGGRGGSENVSPIPPLYALKWNSLYLRHLYHEFDNKVEESGQNISKMRTAKVTFLSSNKLLIQKRHKVPQFGPGRICYSTKSTK